MRPKPFSFRAKRAALRQLTDPILHELDKLSPIDAGSLFCGLLDDFISGIYFLLELIEQLPAQQLKKLENLSDVDQVHADLKPTLRRLCQLSREITFAVEPDRLPVTLRIGIEKLFRFSAEIMPATADTLVNDYLENIRDRTLQPMAVVEQID